MLCGMAKVFFFFVTKKIKKPTEMWEEKHQNYNVIFCLFFFLKENSNLLIDAWIDSSLISDL